MKGAWVTLATNDSYSLGALVLAHSLRQVGTTKELALLVTPGVTASMRSKLSQVFNVVLEVNLLDSKDKANLKLLQRPELGVTFTKLHCWRLTQYEKCVFLDADTLVLQNCDELFEREELSAAPDVGWPDCFNSGVFVYRPSDETYDKLIQFALEKGSFDGGDQGLLNLYFADWSHKDISKHLPFIYNVCSTAFYSYLPAFKQFGKDTKIVHFIGNAKPWLQYFDSETRKVRPSGDLSHLGAILQKWWDIFCSLIHPNLSSDMTPSYRYPENVSTISPRQSPQRPFTQPQPQIQTFVPTYESQMTWDPWEEYDQKQQNSSEHNEAHNTNAFSICANESSNLIEITHSSISHTSDISYQENIVVDSSKEFEHCSPDRSFSESNSDCSNEEKTYHDYSHDESLFCNENYVETVDPKGSTDEFSDNVSASHIDCSQYEQSIPPNSPDKTDDLSSSNAKDPPKSDSIDQSHPSQLNPLESSPIECEAGININNEQSELETEQNESGLAGAFAKLTLGQKRSSEQEALENTLRRQNWEQGNIDYLGKDSFDNIWSKICETLAEGPQPDQTGEPAPAVIQPKTSEPKQSPEKSAATVPQEERQSDPIETKAPVGAQEPRTDPSIEMISASSQTIDTISPSESSDLTPQNIPKEEEKIISTPITAPAAPALPVEAPIAEISVAPALAAPKETTEAPVTPEKPLVEIPLVAAKEDSAKLSPVPEQQDSSKISPAISQSETPAAPKESLPTEPAAPAQQALPLIPSEIPLPPTQTLIEPQQPSAPAADLVGEAAPQTCPLKISEPEKTNASVILDASLQAASEITKTDAAKTAVSAEPILEDPSSKIQTRATSVPISADTPTAEAQTPASSEPSAPTPVPSELPPPAPATQAQTAAPSVQTQPEIPAAQAPGSVPSVQTQTDTPAPQAKDSVPPVQTPTETPGAQVQDSVPSVPTQTETPAAQTQISAPSVKPQPEIIAAPAQSSPPKSETAVDIALDQAKTTVSRAPQTPTAAPASEETPGSQAITTVPTDKTPTAAPATEDKTPAAVVDIETKTPASEAPTPAPVAKSIPEEQTPVPASEIPTETTPPPQTETSAESAAESKPGAASASAPVTPPRKSGGNKKQGKSKK